ncbi:hypothetical protein ES703_108519 [subsurface metagenome]
MATMDVIKLAGAEPANFLDVGGGASEEMVTNGLKIILSDERVKAILINIFGGIMRCDVLARGVVNAAKEVEINVPLIVRLEGTNVEEGREILKNSNLDFSVAQDIEEDKENKPKIKKGVAKDRIISTTDPEMRHGRKSRSGKFNGHKTHITKDVSSEIITNIDVSAGNCPDKKMAESLSSLSISSLLVSI